MVHFFLHFVVSVIFGHFHFFVGSVSVLKKQCRSCTFGRAGYSPTQHYDAHMHLTAQRTARRDAPHDAPTQSRRPRIASSANRVARGHVMTGPVEPI